MPEKKPPCIVAVCGDPGGANAVTPVLEELKKNQTVSVCAFAYNEARHIWKRRSIPYTEIDDRISIASIRNILKELHASLVLTGTSFNSVNNEKKFIAAAKSEKIRSLSILDFWSYYSERFSDSRGELVYLPDKIAVMDHVAFDEMVAQGFNPDNLVITGQPVFDSLVQHQDRFDRTIRTEIRKHLDIPPDATFVLFASQPLSLIFGSDASNPLFPGYTEISVLASLIDSLDRLQEETSQEIVLVIRPHPRERVHGLKKMRHKKIRVVVSDKEDPRDIALASDLVTGMTSMFLVEASYIGCTVISLQPGHTKPDPLPTNRTGLSIAVYTDAEIFPTLKRVLKQHKLTDYADTREMSFSDGRSTQRVIELIQMLIA